MDHHNETRGGAAVLALLAAFSLLVAVSLIGGAPDPLALAQVRATDTSTIAPPHVSPLNGPTNTPPPRPVAYPIEFITNATEAFVLSHRYSPVRGAGRGGAPDGVEPEGQQVERSPDASGVLYLPLIRRQLGVVWRKGAGDGRNNPALFSFVSKLIPSWWYNWRHDYPVSAYYDQLTAKMLRIAADRYAQIYRLIKQTDPSAKVFCCGNFHGIWTTWWRDFLAYLRDFHSDVKIDGVAIHAYPWSKSVRLLPQYDCALWTNKTTIWTGCMQPALQRFRQDHLAELLQPRTPLAANAPIWITETGYLAGPWTESTTPAPTLTYQEVNDYLMQPMVVWLQSGSAGYQAVSWYVMLDNDTYTPLETNQFVYPAPGHTPSALTILGSTWASVTPPTVTPTPTP